MGSREPLISHLAVAADSPIVITARRLSVTTFPTTPPPSLSTPANMTLSRKRAVGGALRWPSDLTVLSQRSRLFTSFRLFCSQPPASQRDTRGQREKRACARVHPDERQTSSKCRRQPQGQAVHGGSGSPIWTPTIAAEGVRGQEQRKSLFPRHRQ